MKRPLRALFYGQTHEHAPGKLETLKRMRDEYEIVAIVDDFPRKSPMYRDQEWDPADYPIVSEEEAWRIPGIDVGFVEVTNCDLMEIAAEFAARGIPMHCDKPCGEDFAAYRRVVETCRAKDIPMQIGYMYRANPALRFIWSFVRAGHLGEIGFVEADMNHDYGYPAADYGRYLAQFGGGIFYNLGCHLVDAVLPFVKGGCDSAEVALDAAPGYPQDSPTSAFATLRFGGATVVLRTACGMGGGILARRLRVDGTLGTADLCPIERFDGEELKLTLTLKGKDQKVMSFGVQDDRYAAQLIDLACVVRGEKANDQDYDRDLTVHGILLEAIANARRTAQKRG